MINKKSKKGFTLTEILVVVLVIAVLAAIAYPLYTKTIAQSRAAEAVNLIEIVKSKQIAKYARDRRYYDKFADMGRLTSNEAKEQHSAAVVKINNYTLALNTSKNCITATYEKGGNKFSFSSGYEEPGLGCDGDICQAFGGVVGSSKSVCGCGDNKCPGGIQNPDTCECGTCRPGDREDCGNCGSRVCGNDYAWGACEGGGICSPGDRTGSGCSFGGEKVCTSSCGWSSCSGGGVCNPGEVKTCGTCGTQSCGGNYQWGACSDKSQPSNETQACGGVGTQTRSYSCNKTSTTATWVPGAWSTCQCPSTHTWNGTTCVSKTIDCPAASKPALQRACGTCGMQTGTVTCNTGTGAWNAVVWGTCSEVSKPADKVAFCGTCGTQTTTYTCNKTSTSANWAASPASCAEVAKPSDETQACGGGLGTQTRSHTCSKTSTTAAWTPGTWGGCVCPSGYTLTGGICKKVCNTTLKSNCALNNGTWNDADCTCTCPANFTLSSNGVCQCSLKCTVGSLDSKTCSCVMPTRSGLALSRCGASGTKTFKYCLTTGTMTITGGGPYYTCSNITLQAGCANKQQALPSSYTPPKMIMCNDDELNELPPKCPVNSSGKVPASVCTGKASGYVCRLTDHTHKCSTGYVNQCVWSGGKCSAQIQSKQIGDSTESSSYVRCP